MYCGLIIFIFWIDKGFFLFVCWFVILVIKIEYILVICIYGVFMIELVEECKRIMMICFCGDFLFVIYDVVVWFIMLF